MTMRCLASLLKQEVDCRSVEIGAVVLDDGSTDGTRHALRAFEERVEVVNGNGDLYWAGGMARAEAHAWRHGPDYFLWLNDDVILDPDAVARLLSLAATRANRCIIVGAVRDPATGRTSYSGVRRRGTHPLRVRLVEPLFESVEVETFNGNVVLVPRAVSALIGPIDGRLGHGAADFDYGLRATRVGVVNLLAPGTVGTCPANLSPSPWFDPARTFSERFRLFLGPKGFPPRARARYLIRHGGPAWPVYWLAPYVRALPELARPREARRL